MLMNRIVVGMLWVGLMVLGAGGVSGQNYPNKPIRVVTAEAGATTDFLTRIIAQGISDPLGQPVIVDNRGTGFITAEIVARAAPDGYTIVVAAGAFWITPLFGKTPYDPIKDFSPITLVSTSPLILVVHPSLPVKSVKELIALAKAKPGEFNYAAGLAGTSTQLAAELFKAMAGVKMVGIPYKGGALGLNAVVGGEVQLMFSPSTSVAPLVKSGKLRALAITSAKPSALVPGLPTVAATLPGYELTVSYGMFAPAKTPTTIVNRLNQETVRVLNRADVKEKLLNVGLETVGGSPGEFAATIKSERAIMGKVIKDAGIKAD